MSKERCYNLFLFVTGSDRMIRELGAAAHELEGADADLLRTLQGLVRADVAYATRRPVPPRYQTLAGGVAVPGVMPFDAYALLFEQGRNLEPFEDLFRELGGVPANPLVCVTPVVDGKPVVEAVVRF